MCHREACRAHWVLPDVTRPELKVRGRPIFILTLHVRKTRERKTGLGGAAKGTAQQHHKAGRAERHHKAGVRRAAGKGCHKEVSVIHEDLIIFALYENQRDTWRQEAVYFPGGGSAAEDHRQGGTAG